MSLKLACPGWIPYDTSPVEAVRRVAELCIALAAEARGVAPFGTDEPSFQLPEAPPIFLVFVLLEDLPSWGESQEELLSRAQYGGPLSQTPMQVGTTNLK